MSILSSLQNIFKIAELKNRVFFTLSLLAVYRIGAHIPTPGINGEELSRFLMEKGGALMGFFDMFSGGALSRVTIFALGIMPYISASIIFQLLTVVIPAIGKLAKEGITFIDTSNGLKTDEFRAAVMKQVDKDYPDWGPLLKRIEAAER